MKTILTALAFALMFSAVTPVYATKVVSSMGETDCRMKSKAGLFDKTAHARTANIQKTATRQGEKAVR